MFRSPSGIVRTAKDQGECFVAKLIARCYSGSISKISQQDMNLASLPYCPKLISENCADLGLQFRWNGNGPAFV